MFTFFLSLLSSKTRRVDGTPWVGRVTGWSPVPLPLHISQSSWVHRDLKEIEFLPIKVLLSPLWHFPFPKPVCHRNQIGNVRMMVSDHGAKEKQRNTLNTCFVQTRRKLRRLPFLGRYRILKHPCSLIFESFQGKARLYCKFKQQTSVRLCRF